MTDAVIRARTTVQGFLDELQAERDETWDRERLVAQAALRQSLEDRADRTRFIKAGDVVRSFSLPEVEGGTVVLSDLLADGPVVLIFFRFEECPACNAAWKGYQQLLVPALRDLGAHLIAVSPQAPEKLVAIKRRYNFDFPVASDTDATLLHEFGIAFAPSDNEIEEAIRAGNDLGARLGTGKWELPYPSPWSWGKTAPYGSPTSIRTG